MRLEKHSSLAVYCYWSVPATRCSFCPGGGIPLLWLFLKLLPYFVSLFKGVFLEDFSLTIMEGLRTEGVVRCTDCKALYVIVVCDYGINK